MAFINARVECKAAPVADFDLADYERVFGVNVKGAFLTAQAVVRHLIDAGRSGGVLFTASIAGLEQSIGSVAGAAAGDVKAGIMA